MVFFWLRLFCHTAGLAFRREARKSIRRAPLASKPRALHQSLFIENWKQVDKQSNRRFGSILLIRKIRLSSGQLT